MTIFAKRSNSFAERLNSFAERLNSFAEVLGLPYQHKYTNRFRTKALSSQQNRLLQTFDAFGIVHNKFNCYKHSIPSASFTLNSTATNIEAVPKLTFVILSEAKNPYLEV
jgi:hypothetical protein